MREGDNSGLDALTRNLTDVFSSASLVNGSFLSEETSSGLDVMGLESIYVKIMKLNDTHVLLAKLMQAFNLGIEALLSNVKELTDPDSLRCVLAYWQCPLNSNTTLSKEPFQKLCDVIVRLPPESRQQVRFKQGREESKKSPDLTCTNIHTYTAHVMDHYGLPPSYLCNTPNQTFASSFGLSLDGQFWKRSCGAHNCCHHVLSFCYQ